MVTLTRKQITQIYNDFKGKKLKLDEMIKKYCIDIDEYVYYKCSIEFKRGIDYEEKGIIKKDDYKKILNKFANGHELYLGEINGKHSEGTANQDNFVFYEGNKEDEKGTVEKYIVRNGKGTSEEYFYDHFSDCKEKCKCEDNEIDKESD